MAKPICIIPTCPHPVYARDWCSPHYQRWYRTGDPLTGTNLPPVGTGGVYSITCLASGWVYIGSSMSIRQRWTTHKSWLRNGRHNVPRLQADWGEHGEAAFDFALVTVAELAADRYAREQEHLNVAWLTGKCYNLSPSALDNTGHRFTPEQAQRVSDGLKGHTKSAEWRGNLWRDREVTPEHVENMRRVGAASRGKPKTAEQRAKISAAQAHGKGFKLNEDRARDIKRRLADGEPVMKLAAEFNLSPAAVYNIRHGRAWGHVVI